MFQNGDFRYALYKVAVASVLADAFDEILPV